MAVTSIKRINTNISTKKLNSFQSLNTPQSENVEITPISFDNETVELSNNPSIMEQIGDAVKTTGANAAVGYTSVMSGILKIGEGIEDGITWVRGKEMEGATWVAGQVAGIFSDDAKGIIMSEREKGKQWVKEDIARDKVGEINKIVYEDTSIGRAINDKSALKYNSETAGKIQSVSTTVGKVAIATGATVATGGAAAPIALGFAFGTGSSAEKKYQQDLNSTGAEEFGIFLSGVAEGANWYATGKMGEGALNVAKAVNANGLVNTASAIGHNTKSVITTIKNKGLTKLGLEFIKSNPFGKAIKGAALDKSNIVESVGIVADNVSDWATGEEDLTIDSIKTAGAELATAWTFNVFAQGLSDYLSSGHFQVTTLDEYKELDNMALDKNMTLKELGAQKQVDGRITEEMQQVADTLAMEKRALAESAEEAITSEMKALETSDRQLTGLSHRLKGEDSLSRKIISDSITDGISLQEASDKIGDSVRYTMLCDEKTMTKDVTECITKLNDDGYSIKKFKNTFDKHVYKGLNVSVEAPDGTLFELQFHTAESFDTKESLNHLFYEINRNKFTTEAEKELADKIMKINTGKVKVPDGMLDLKLSDILGE